MNGMHLLVMALALSLVAVVYYATKLHNVSEQLSIIEESLADIKKGNWNRRILAGERDRTQAICYAINDIAMNSQTQLVQLKQSEQAYKRLMTSLSHDVKTPLTSLVGYLEAIEQKWVTGEEKDEYIGVALYKAHHLKGFVEALFDWVKLDAREQLFQPALQDIHELTRNLLTDWVPTLEDNHFGYHIDIPDKECVIPLDSRAYMRIINNVLQNTISHSGGSEVMLQISENDQSVTVRISDNGKGIAPDDLPHIFDRLYQGDASRSTGGNGLGLAIAKELALLHKGMIYAEPSLSGGAAFVVKLPKAL